jgi:hypothetical protein
MMGTPRGRFRIFLIRSILPAMVLAALTGCGLFHSRLVTLCTNRPEMAAYVELFNALGADLQVVLCYQPDPAAMVASRSGKADVVVGAGLNGLEAKRHLEPLDRLFGEEGLQREDFYLGSLAAGLHERKQVALPLSFGLPAVVFLAGSLGEEAPSLSVSPEYLRELSGEFRESVREGYVRMGFSPLWNNSFLYHVLDLNGAGFREADGGEIQWDAEGLAEGVRFLRTWIDEADGGHTKSEEFSRKYLYEPMAKLVDEKRVFYYLSDTERLLKDLESHGEEVDFRWLGGAEGVPVEESVVSVGIPRGAGNKWGARIFVDWLLDSATQRRLLEINQSKRLSSFGLLGGFSSLRRVTEQEFPRVYPLFIGRIPPAELLIFPEALPVRWESLKAEAVLPWARDFLNSPARDEEAGEALRSWLHGYRGEPPSQP